RAQRVHAARRRARRETRRHRCARRHDDERAAPGTRSRRRRTRARHQSIGRAIAWCGRTRRPGGKEVTLAPPPEGINVDEELTANLENGVLWLTINRADKGN